MGEQGSLKRREVERKNGKRKQGRKQGCIELEGGGSRGEKREGLRTNEDEKNNKVRRDA